MYYSEIEKLKRIEKYLEELAYGSVALDFMVAVGSFLLLHKIDYAGFIIQVSNYAITAEILIAAILFVTLLAIKHYKKIIENFEIGTFKMKHKKHSILFRSVKQKDAKSTHVV